MSKRAELPALSRAMPRSPRGSAPTASISTPTRKPMRARDLLGQEASIGAGCGLSRHEAILLAEKGADYVAFEAVTASGIDTIDQCAELVAWWEEMFLSLIH